MPLTAKGTKVMAAMTAEYGAKKGASVFYASKNAGKLKGVEGKSADREMDHSAAHITAMHKAMKKTTTKGM